MFNKYAKIPVGMAWLWKSALNSPFGPDLRQFWGDPLFQPSCMVKSATELADLWDHCRDLHETRLSSWNGGKSYIPCSIPFI